MRRLNQMTDNIKFAEDMAMVILRNRIGTKNPTEAEIKKAIEETSILLPLQEIEKIVVEKNIQSKMSWRMDLGVMIVDPATYKPWLSGRKASITSYYWNRYRDFLLRDKGWNENVTDALGDVSDEILNLIGNPEEKAVWKRKGLILGDIQSGKTSNYIALCNKAADAGYKVVILLTGTLETLRKQTCLLYTSDAADE